MRAICTVFRSCLRFYSRTATDMKYLNVAEKNDAAKTIAGLLSNGTARRREGLSVYNKIYDFEMNVRGQKSKMVMTSVSGHLLNYEFVAAYKSWNNCDPIQLMEAPIRKSVTADGEKIKKTLEREIRGCGGLIIWTDCDREGENIGYEIIEVCKAMKPNIPVYRAKFSEITSASVKRALANLIQPDPRQNIAVDIRQELDLRTGAAFTRYQTLRLQRVFPGEMAEKLISYGSCQIPTLGFVAKRYKEMEDFVSEPFWKLKVIHTIDDLTVEFHWAKNRLFDKEACEDCLLLCLADPMATVESVTVKNKNKWRPQPMDTVELEKLGSRKLKINAKQVMSIAEKLYTQGIISYPRTETNMFSKEIDLKSLVQQQAPHPDWGQFATRVLEWVPNPRNGNKSDQAHPPIHPTKFVTNLNGNEQRVYELIVRHFLACVSKDATGSETIVKIDIAGEKFSANGLVIFERNYLDVYPYEKWNGKLIHNYEQGMRFEPTEISMVEGATTAPPLLTEADLIVLMEKHGIGTDATHADHIQTIKDRGYIGEVENGLLVPGTIGMGLYEGYDAMQLPLAEPVLRAEFESDLKKICAGEKDAQAVLREQIQKYKAAYRTITEKIRALDEKMAQRINQVPQETSEENLVQNRIQDVLKCPKCNICSMALKSKKDNAGYFVGCLGYPDCRNVVWLSDDIRHAEATEIQCSRCGPGYFKVRFKFKQAVYMALLNADGPTYTTCISCDSKFREVFNINVESVKRVGPIVSDSNRSSRPRNTNTTTTTNSTRVLTDNINSRTISTNSSSAGESTRNDGSQATSRYRGWNFDDIENIPDNSSVTSTNRNNSNTFNRNPSPVRTPSNNWGSIDDFNDDFFADTDWDTVAANPAPLQHPIQSNNNNTVRQPSNSNNVPSWGSLSTGQGPSRPEPIRNRNLSLGETRNQNSRPTADDTRNRNPWPNMDEFGSDQPTVKCSTCQQVLNKLTVRKEGANKGRNFYSCSNQQCNFFKWAEDIENESSSTGAGNAQNNRQSNGQQNQSRPRQQNSSNNATAVLCSVCQQPAKRLVVRKEGPNTGKNFYTCPKQPPDTFFQWADEDDFTVDDHGWGSGSNGRNNNRDQPSTSRSSGNNRQAGKKRKCGLCREEGHTKLKCPRKDEFVTL